MLSKSVVDDNQLQIFHSHHFVSIIICKNQRLEKEIANHDKRQIKITFKHSSPNLNRALRLQ